MARAARPALGQMKPPAYTFAERLAPSLNAWAVASVDAKTSGRRGCLRPSLPYLIASPGRRRARRALARSGYERCSTSTASHGARALRGARAAAPEASGRSCANRCSPSSDSVGDRSPLPALRPITAAWSRSGGAQRPLSRTDLASTPERIVAGQRGSQRLALHQAFRSGRGWDRTSDPSRVKRVLSR